MIKRVILVATLALAMTGCEKTGKSQTVNILNLI